MFIQKIILWSRDATKNPKVYTFEKDKLNIIYGDSKTGKSALIPIVDYCLCSSDCRIPAGVIRQACGWYGIVLRVGDESLLLARKDPGSKATTADMYTAKAKSLVIPLNIESPNNSSYVVKNELNQLLEITDLQLSDDESPYSSRPSVRDEAAFLFQPQNIIANPEALFYKLDDFDHRRKLMNAFPYFLGALTRRELSIRDALSENRRKIDTVDREIEKISNLSEKWLDKIDVELARAVEFGLSSFHLDSDEKLSSRIEEIKRISELGSLDSCIDDDCLDQASAKLHEYEEQDRDLSAKLYQLQERRHLIESALKAYSEHDHVKQSLSNYLGTVEWMANNVNNRNVCPICGASLDACPDIAGNLVSLMESIGEGDESSGRLSLDKELEGMNREVQSVLDERKLLAQSIRSLSEEVNKESYRFGEIDRFIGELRASYRQYTALQNDGGLKEERNRLMQERSRLEREYDQREIEEKKARALNTITRFTADYIKLLDVEDSRIATKLDIKNLSLKIQDEPGSSRYRYLNQIGSASNWLSYHIALSLALQRFFQTSSPVGMPAFMIYDQPSQVYFPHEIDDSRDKDKQAVKRLISLLEGCASSSAFPCQIILTEHAGKDVWGDLSEVNVVAHWESEGEKLVPSSWVSE